VFTAGEAYDVRESKIQWEIPTKEDGEGHFDSRAFCADAGILRRFFCRFDFPVASLRVIHQAATLARHFNSEIVVLHVVTALSHAAGVPEDSREMADWDLLAAIIRQAEKQQDQSLGPELDGLTIQRKLVKGDAAVANCADG